MIEPAALAIEVAHISHDWLRTQRWFGAKGRAIAALDAVDWGSVPGADTAIVALARVRYVDGGSEIYALPLLASDQQRLADSAAPAVLELAGGMWMHDALAAPTVRDTLLDLMLYAAELPMQNGQLLFRPEPALLELPPWRGNSRLLSVEQSNSSLVYDDRAFLKLFRRVSAGLNPDVEVGRFLTRAGFADTPPTLGDVVYRSDGPEASLALLQAWVPNHGAAWDNMLKRLAMFFAAAGDQHDAGDVEDTTLRLASDHWDDLERIGSLTAGMHRALAWDADDAAFAPRPITPAMLDEWKTSLRGLRDTIMPQLAARAPSLPTEQRALVERLQAAGVRIEGAIASLDVLEGVTATRYHGDYHLGQLLVIDDGFLVIDFEGEPMRSLQERRAHGSPLKDVAGMLRSLSYAASAGLFAARDATPGSRLESYAAAWEQHARSAFLDGYWGSTLGSSFVPRDEHARDRVLRTFELEKALYELGYELHNRPDWLPIPLRGSLQMLKAES